MVKTLFKYEFKSYLKTLIPFNIVLLSIAAFTRLIQFFDLDIVGYDVVYDIVFALATMTYVLAIVACFAAVFVMAIIRFYKNLYTAEGYLSFTLPVTPGQPARYSALTFSSSSIFSELRLNFMLTCSTCSAYFAIQMIS